MNFDNETNPRGPFNPAGKKDDGLAGGLVKVPARPRRPMPPGNTRRVIRAERASRRTSASPG